MSLSFVILCFGTFISASLAFTAFVVWKSTSKKLTRVQGELKEAKQANFILDERYRLLTTNIAASVFVRSTSGEILFASPYTEVLTGHDPDEICGTGLEYYRSLIADDDLPRYDRALRLSELGEDSLVRYKIKHLSGMTLWMETRMVPVPDDDGEVETVLDVTLDVTSSVTYQRQIEEQNKDLNDFAYMVSHDLKAPIFTIKGMASALLEDHGNTLTMDARELLNYIVDATKRLESLVSSVIEYSAISSKPAAESDVELGLILENVVKDNQELIRLKGAVVNFPADFPSVRAEPVRMYQLFANLVGNALKYSSPERSPKIEISVHELNANIFAIEITDNGLGIAREKLGDIFRPYQRAHTGTVDGNGIGLACVKKIIDRIGGTITVQSTVGVGSTFTICLPTVDARAQRIPKELHRAYQI